jgi:hypothetical protein
MRRVRLFTLRINQRRTPTFHYALFAFSIYRLEQPCAYAQVCLVYDSKLRSSRQLCLKEQEQESKIDYSYLADCGKDTTLATPLRAV